VKFSSKEAFKRDLIWVFFEFSRERWIRTSRKAEKFGVE